MTWLGIVLIVLAVGLVIAEFFTGSGILFIGGIAALVFGVIILFTQGTIFTEINLWVVIPLIIVILGLIVFIVFRIVNTYHSKAVTGKEDLEGKLVIVKTKLDPEGTIFYQGEYWNAVSESGKIDPGEEVIIKQVDGLLLHVIKHPKY